jgi:glycosyltransferase involved in cell wall biosynthesis
MLTSKKKIKICFYSLSSFELFVRSNEVSHGGAQFQMYLLAKKMAEFSNYEIRFFVGDYAQPKIMYIDNIKLIKTLNLEKKEIVFSKIYKSIKLFFLLVKHNSDIIISTTASPFVGIIAFYKIIFRKKHLHRTAHLQDVDNTWIIENGLFGKIYKWGLLNADTIITQNFNHQKLLLKTLKIKSEVLRNGYEIEEIKKIPNFDFLWVGRFEKWKNPELYLELASRLIKSNFVMICPYSRSDYPDWMHIKQKANSLSNMIFIEKVPFYEIQNYFNQSKIFVNTSESEGFPNTFLQAAQARMPIISLNVNPDFFITKYNCGIYCNNSFENLVESAQYLINNNEEIEKRGENVFGYLKKNHDLDKISIQFKIIIEKLV